MIVRAARPDEVDLVLDVLADLERHGVTYTPIVDAPYGAVLVFCDPDNIQLELMAEPGT